MKIDVKAIKELSENIEKYGLEEITLESEGTKVSLKREIEKATVTQVVAEPRVVAAAPRKAKKAKTEVETKNYDSIKSPMVGTFYGAPSPDADKFVKEGQIVEVGDILCIVEAMKLMNEVKAEKRCRIVKAVLTDGAPVTKGADLFLIEEV
ncbi:MULTISPECIES: acetyl-CoA carboxylase biotin carboxyl carrier protein [Psychrilyobacter]|uniref:Biotin carboxyl carrier protein of acetyl-CoA carboxylase n=1 Tax=Psychrilyobacter piezotolerans TaxID=2293438 RepID=A0ABX9KK35_9FUSO|nr:MULTISPECIES: acetyl-CoA carboxylase biotin carboxyl carrier protein [Psychrilyobacter]MCS5421414.1 acetyl-CoA carboxylase biotin carboxyl carrier protein [Psychrilyobacter sp. S5]NDI76604.1 acetyl-CoA carboxylase biotin carboxyl carrier protein [Psychrilyobacter piezotolerans]RDE65234.1 acetyl-CoA carboxylase biotin carboxyl carrier protein [Psychrilyobacter sp. S5]REI42852.1 acetyl-CoA carboxylase biotin carboxyl carrier protein [Psychrilyobacter piezotolerans]